MLILGISTSAGQFALILGENNRAIFNSADYGTDNELDTLLLKGLAVCKKNIDAISHIIIDTGPGGTSRVRTGIAFANSLAYGLHVPVCPVSSTELAGIDACGRYNLPAVNTVKSIKGNAYVGFYDGTRENEMKTEYGRIEEIVPRLTADVDEFVVVGAHRDTIARLPELKEKTVVDSGMQFGNACVLIEKSDLFIGRGLLFPEFAVPVTEQTI
jgi:tRNA A37 threonylcarbamoyladenosine modification protein TsaB